MKKRIFALLLALVMALGLTATAWADDPVTGVSYVDENGVVQTCETYTEITEAYKPNEWTNGWYVVKDNVTIGTYVNITGNVNLILCDGKTLTVTFNNNKPGIKIEDGSLTIYGQSGQTGALTSTSKGGAGIEVERGTLTINGGKVTAIGTGWGLLFGLPCSLFLEIV